MYNTKKKNKKNTKFVEAKKKCFILTEPKFGDMFFTRSGKKAVYLYTDKKTNNRIMMIEGIQDLFAFDKDGSWHPYGSSCNDIVSNGYNETIESLKDELDALNMRYVSQVSLYKSLYEQEKNKNKEKNSYNYKKSNNKFNLFNI